MPYISVFLIAFLAGLNWECTVYRERIADITVRRFSVVCRNGNAPVNEFGMKNSVSLAPFVGSCELIARPPGEIRDIHFSFFYYKLALILRFNC